MLRYDVLVCVKGLIVAKLCNGGHITELFRNNHSPDFLMCIETRTVAVLS